MLQRRIHQVANTPEQQRIGMCIVGTLNMAVWYLLRGSPSVRLARLVTMAKSPYSGTPDAVHVWEQTFPGAIEQAGQVRAALRPELRDCPIADEVVLLFSELSANAVAHSASGNPGGKFTVRLQHFPGQYIWGEVEDDGSDWDGKLRDSAREASGLFLVIKLASACGVDRGTNGHRVAWFRIDYTAGDNGDLGCGASSALRHQLR